jgi:hypothetical protein
MSNWRRCLPVQRHTTDLHSCSVDLLGIHLDKAERRSFEQEDFEQEEANWGDEGY